jgi:hypothetical protein
MPNNDYRYGLEGEYLLVEAATFRPLWHQDLTFARLNGLLESIDFGPLLEGLPLDGLELDPPHRKLMPYYVEGYAMADSQLSTYIDVRPKGIEVRTPICPDLETCLRVYENLYQGLQQTLAAEGLRAVGIGHHPLAGDFGPMLAYHPKEGGRVEFKAFDMPTDRGDFQPFFLLWLWLMHDTDAPGRADDHERIYDLGAVARFGWEADEVIARVEEALDRAITVLPTLEVDIAPLRPLRQRLERRWVPAHGVIDYFRQVPSVPRLMQYLDRLAEPGFPGRRDGARLVNGGSQPAVHSTNTVRR